MPDVTRRALVKNALKRVAAGVGVASVAPLLLGARSKNPGRLVISGWGGVTQQAMREAYFAPFTNETGIEIVEQTYGSQGLARIKAQLREGGAQVDLLDGAPFWPAIGRKQGLLDRISLPEVDKSQFVRGAIGEYSFGYSTVSWGLTCIKGRKPTPQSWRDFWNTRDFSGRRALFGPFVARHPEYALMADGVALKDVNPLDDAKIERAFAKLQQIKPSIDVWYQTASQCEQLLMDKQIDMVEFFNGRAFFLQDQGVPVEFIWNEAITNMPVFVLAAKAPNRENALRFLTYIARPEPQAAFARSICYGPTNTSALNLISDRKTLERLPTYPANFAKQIVLDGDWWGENQDRFGPRWSRLISS